MDGTEADGRKNALPSTREFVEKYGLMAKKALGQNFLLDREYYRQNYALVAGGAGTERPGGGNCR